MDVQSDQDASEQLSDSFVCCVCLDLLYKPIVLSCGHVACFWCVHISMNGFRESHCPICRSPYYHFPTVCQMLHFLLVKMYPLTYKRRQKQVLEDEKKMGSFSPDFDRNDQKLSSTSLNLHSSREGEDSVNTEELDISSGSCEQVSVADLSCVSCKQLLFRPVVLNCGHVYCETCIVIPEDDTLKCEVCESPHPRGFPKVCLELHHFLEEKFPTEYALRKNTAQLKKVPLQQETQTTCKSTKSDNVTQGIQFRGEGNILPWWGDQASNIHIGAGCDSCGMYPIIGDRYRCKDCVEAIGFDLCGNCYNTRSKLPGRFNQQHTPEHRFENIKNSVHEFMLTLWNSQPENGLDIPVLTSEEQELVETLPALNEQVSDRVDNDLIDPNNISSDDQTESQNSQPPSRAI